jgi:hypothetical protein
MGENMGKLSEDLPAITKEVLHDEDKVTKGLVKTLLQAVVQTENKSDAYPTVRRILDDEIDKNISSGLIDLRNFEN